MPGTHQQPAGTVYGGQPSGAVPPGTPPPGAFPPGAYPPGAPQPGQPGQPGQQGQQGQPAWAPSAPGAQSPGTAYGPPPQSFGTPPGNRHPGAPPPPGPAAPKKPWYKRGPILGGVIAAVILLVVCVSGVFFAADNLNSDYSAGKCIQREASGDKDRAVPVDCNTEGAYEIIDRANDTTTVEDGSCPPDTTDAFVNFKDEYVLCLRKQD